MSRIITTYIFIFVTFYSLGQTYQPILFPEKVDKKYIMNPITEEEKYRKKVGKKIPRKHIKPFTYSVTYAKAEMFKEGKVYLNWGALENYLNQILDSILPGNLKNKKIKVFIGRSSEINAFCLYDGTMIVNAGLIGEIKNEAALAVIMGHELVHYSKNHILNEYAASFKKKKNRDEDALDLAINNRGYSQKLELEADEIGFAITKDAGYDVSQAYSNFELFIRGKEYIKKRNTSELVTEDSVKVQTKSGLMTANSLEKLLNTHPDEKERKEKLSVYLKNNPNIKKTTTKMDADLFLALQRQARLESISLIFSEHNYTECLERAFCYHLFDPNEITYIYYIAESIRRICLLDYTLRKKGFLAEKLTNSGFKEGQGILHDLKYLIPNEEQYSKIKSSEFLKPNVYPFETYKEAFYYFNDKLIKKDYSEAHLMAALFENNTSKQQKSISNYLSHPKAKRKEYAKNYLNNTLVTQINTNAGEIVMIPRVDFYSHSRYDKQGAYGQTRYNYEKSEILGSEMSKEISSRFNTKLSNIRSISLPQASIDNFNTKEKYEEMIFSSFLAKREENEGYTVSHYYKELEDEDYIGKVDIFRLNPEIWDFFIEKKINAISYAKYTRHLSNYDKLLRRPGLYLGIPTFGLTWLFLPLRIANYKQLSVYTYDSQAENVLSYREVNYYRLNSKKAVKMFKHMRKKKAEYIKENYTPTP
jgi:hypothetical protein